MSARRAACVLAVVLAAASPTSGAEYGDVVLNRRSDAEHVRPVVFPHWFHRIRFRCDVCHQERGFRMKAGANDITMRDIVDGRYCGMCHNGQVAWSVERCDLCHSAKPGAKAGVSGGHHTSGPGIW